jgi:3-(3-hydroxy-phenyl)propionate hydroxylase
MTGFCIFGATNDARITQGWLGMIDPPDRHQSHAVVIIGAGPTGLTLANLLGVYGVSVLLVERNHTTVQEPRAVSIDDESLRTMQAAGMSERVLEHVVAGYGSKYLSPSGRCFLEVAPTETNYGYPRRNAFRQPIFEAQLREGLGRFASVETRFGTRFQAFRQNKQGVEVDLVNSDGDTSRVHCAYLVGCDGAGSAVRGTLGVVLQGRTFAEKWLIVDLEESPSPHRDTIVFCDSRRPCIALPGPNLTRRFEFKLHDGENPETMCSDEVVAQLLAQHGAAPSSTIRRKTVYTFHARLAPTWAVGRVFLAGDACHLTPPFAGQGMNSGIRDAHNLSWKIAAVVQERLGPGLLESYQRERLNHVGEMIELALRMGRIMGPKSRVRGALTQLAFRCLNVWPPARSYFAEMKYKPKPRFTDGFLVPVGAGARHTLVGRLIPQPVAQNDNGVTLPLDAALGEGFSLLSFIDDPARFAAETAQRIWQQLGVRRILITTSGARSTAVVAVLKVPREQLVGANSRVKDLVLLLRPDRYVAAAFPLAEVEDFAARVASLCAATRESSADATLGSADANTQLRSLP